MEKEIWKKTHLSNDYEVSNFGKVKSLKKGKVRILKSALNTRGYKHVALWINNKGKQITVHRLVCQAFLENPNKYLEINHKDGNKVNNNASNLEWCSSKMNNLHAMINGLHVEKLTCEDVVKIKEMISYKTQYEIAKMFNVHQSTISDIKRGKTWSFIN